jgi:hypothetical protein
MRTVRTVLVALVLLGGLALGVRRALQPPIDLLIVPGAVGIQLQSERVGEQVLSYHAPGAAYAWRAIVERRLVTHQWSLPGYWYPSTRSKPIYRIEIAFGLGTYVRQVELAGEPNVARITIRHWVVLPLWMEHLLGHFHTALVHARTSCAAL